ncbi:MAG TPA: hypothetical protein VLC46_16340 [Thermoanaerobaculia bacterium]|nr:hypothetical protein [Thermoanaerobaculia bacterium]
MIAIACFFVGLLLAGWAALVIQSLVSGGTKSTYLASELRMHFPPEDDNLIILDDDFTFVDSTGQRWTAPKGLESDGASVGGLLGLPFIGWLVERVIEGSPLTGPLRVGAIPHDAIYAGATESSIWRALIAPARAEADRVIFEAARCKVYNLPEGSRERHRPLPTWKAFIVMALLRLAGCVAWMDDCSKAQKSLERLAKA